MTTDLERIEELHRADMRASKERDYRTLRSLMSDDAVVLPPGVESSEAGTPWTKALPVWLERL